MSIFGESHSFFIIENQSLIGGKVESRLDDKFAISHKKIDFLIYSRYYITRQHRMLTFKGMQLDLHSILRIKLLNGLRYYLFLPKDDDRDMFLLLRRLHRDVSKFSGRCV